jgi:D-arabinose 1-dehydrogenase-like Zn-dependent alcohol dehydrogenase
LIYTSHECAIAVEITCDQRHARCSRRSTTITGSIMGTPADMKNMMNLIAQAGIKPKIGAVLPMERAEEAFRAMWQGKTHGKTVFTR